MIYTSEYTSDLHLIFICRRIEANKTKFVRSAVGNFLDHVNLVMQTMEEFGPPVEKKQKL